MAKNICILPAILTDDPAALEKMVRQTESFTDTAQMDIMDGQFVPSSSISYRDIAVLKPKFNWEAHLMVKQPEDCVENFKKAGAWKIVFHYEATDTPEKTIRAIKKLNMLVGLAINPKTALSEFDALVKQVDSVLFLSVEPGFYGAEFIPGVLDKIGKFCKAYPEMETGIDGGVKESNITQIVRSGVKVICVGSAIFRQPDPAASYRRLTELANATIM